MSGTHRNGLVEPALAGVEVRGITREALILRAALAAGAAYGLGAVGPHVRRALAQTGAGDADVARFALTLEQLQSAYYRQALDRVSDLSTPARAVASEILDQEQQHVRQLQQLIVQLGGTPVRRLAVDFGDAFGSQNGYLRLAERLEEAAVGAYNGAMPQIFSRSVLVVFGEMVQIEGRQAAVIRELQDREIAPGAFDEPLDRAQAERVIDPYLPNS